MMKRLIFILFGVLICGLTIAQDEVRMHGAGAEPVLDVKSASYNESTGGDEFTRLNPEYAHRTTCTEVITETNLDTDSTYYAFEMDTYDNAIVYWFLSGGATLTVYVSPDENASSTDETTGDWINAGTFLLGAASVSDEDDFFTIDSSIQFEKVLIKVETSDATNSISVWEKRY